MEKGILKPIRQVFDTRRNHLQILTDILELCRIPQSKTHILYSTNTNFRLLESYLLKLQASELLELTPERRKYSTTTKGLKFIRTWIKLQEIVNPQQIHSAIKTRKRSINNKQLIIISD